MLPIVRPVMVVISADVPVRVVIAPLMPRIVDEVVLPIVNPVIVAISADVPVKVVIAPDAPRNWVVTVVPNVVPVKVVMFALAAFSPVNEAEP